MTRTTWWTTLHLAAAVAACISISHSASAAPIPISVSGLNADLVVEASATAPYSDDAEGFDIPNQWAYFETGLEGQAAGLPVDGEFNADGTGTEFDIADYSGDNALLLSSASPSGVLTLDTPSQLASLHVLAVSTNGGGAGALVVTYDDNSTMITDYAAPDWYGDISGSTTFSNAFSPAIQGLGRIRLTDDLIDTPTGNPDLYETIIPLDSSKAVVSLEFTRAVTLNSANTSTGIFALSGEVVPEPSTMALLGLAGLGLVGWRFRR